MRRMVSRWSRTLSILQSCRIERNGMRLSRTRLASRLSLTASMVFGLLSFSTAALAQGAILDSLTTTHNYVQKRVSSYDKTGGNADAIGIAAGATATLIDQAGPGLITHIWFTIASPE